MEKAQKFCSVVIDNSALTNLLNSDDLLAKLEARLKTNTYRLIVPDDAIYEATSGTKIDFMHGRLAKLASLVRKYPDHVILAKESGTWVRHEWINGGVLRNIPHRRNSPRFNGILTMLEEKPELKRIHTGVEETRNKAQERKVELARSDQNFREMCMKALPKGEPLGILMSLKDRVPLATLGSLQLVFSFLPGFSKRKFRRAFYSKSRYQMLRCYVSLTYIRALANAVEPAECPQELQKLVKIQKGNWYDLGPIATAAFQDYLISDDEGQRAMADFAVERGFVKCSAVTLKDHLS